MNKRNEGEREGGRSGFPPPSTLTSSPAQPAKPPAPFAKMDDGGYVDLGRDAAIRLDDPKNHTKNPDGHPMPATDSWFWVVPRNSLPGSATAVETGRLPRIAGSLSRERAGVEFGDDSRRVWFAYTQGRMKDKQATNETISSHQQESRERRRR